MAKGKKGDGEKKGDGGKKKAPAHSGPTELEREELRLKVAALETKLLGATRQLEGLLIEHAGTKEALVKQQSDQEDIVSYLKKEIEKKVAENTSLQQKLVLLREAKENAEIRMQHELGVARSASQSAQEQFESSVQERHRLDERLSEYTTLKEQSITNAALINSLQTELASTKAALTKSCQQLHIVAANDDFRMSCIQIRILLLQNIGPYPWSLLISIGLQKISVELSAQLTASV